MATLPVRVHEVRAGAGVDDAEARVLVTCRREDQAQRIAVLLEQIKRAGGFVPDDANVEYFAFPADVDLDIGDAAITDVAPGYAVRSVVLAKDDIPTGKVIATVAGAAIELPADVRPDPAAQAGPIAQQRGGA